MFLSGLASRVLAGVVTVGVLGGGFAWYQLNPQGFESALSSTTRMIAWLAVVAVLPFATFFVIGRVAKMDSNAAGATLVGIYTALEIVLLLWLWDWRVDGALAWTFFLCCGLTAAAYNLLLCDWLAEKIA